MSGLLMALALCAAVPADASPAAERPFHEISGQLRDLMRREALARTDAERVAAVYALAELYLELKRDGRLEGSATLQQYKAKVWSRLTKVKKEIVRQQQRRQALANRGRTQAEIRVEQESRGQADQASEILAAQLALVSYSMGGPASLFAESSRGAFGGGAAADHGAALVALITRVIEPDFWDIHGGPGTIFYYAPLHALVVRATAEVHHKIGGAVRGLRAAGP